MLHLIIMCLKLSEGWSSFPIEKAIKNSSNGGSEFCVFSIQFNFYRKQLQTQEVGKDRGECVLTSLSEQNVDASILSLHAYVL